MLASFTEKYGITFPLLADVGSHVIRELGVLNEALAEHQAFYGREVRPHQWGVPYPGTFLLDEDGVIVERRFYESYRVRETGASILEAGFGLESTHDGPEARASLEGISIRARLDSPTYHSMQRLLATVVLDIEPDIHVYASPVPYGFTALAVTVEPNELRQVGPIEFPASKAFRLDGLDEQFQVYEGRVVLHQPLTFMERSGDLTIKLDVRLQACTTVDCFPPSSVRLELPVQSAPHVESDR